MKAIFIVNQIKQKGQIPEKMYGCSYSIYPTPDLAVLYNAAVLKKAGYEVSLFYIKKIEDVHRLPLANIYLINSVILSYKSDIEIAKKIKKNVCCFGPYPTLFPEKYLIKKNIFVLRGETEHALISAIKDPLGSKGVSYLKDNKIFNNETAGIIEDLDIIPFPLREIDEEKYFNPKLNCKKFTNVLASRGCANKCKFCVPNSISWSRELEWKKFNSGKPPVKIRSANNVIKELKLIKEQGFEEFSFVDDQFIVEKNRVLEISKAIKKLGLTYGMLARADRLLDEEIISSLACSKCRYIDIGAESFDQEVLNDINKGIKVEKIFQAINLLAKHKIEPKINIMFGTSAKETKKVIEDTVKKTLSLPSNYCMFSIATPFPGTEFRRVAEKNNWIIKNNDTNPASVAQIGYPGLSGKDLEQISKNANIRFYLRPKIFFVVFKKALSLKSINLYTKLLSNWLKNFR